jgi:hypothetical protein
MYYQFSMIISKLCYSLQAFKHNAPYRNEHCDIKNEPFNHAFTYYDNLKKFCHVLRPRNHVIA